MELIEGEKTKNGPSSPRNARNEHAPKRRLTATRTSPEVLRKWRGRESSPGSGPLDSPSRLLLQSVALRVSVIARYSGGAAPASNRFPWLPSAINYWAKLSTSKRLRKRQDHRASDQERKRHEIARIDRSSRLRRRRKIYDRHGFLGHVRRQEAAEVALVDGNRIDFLQVWTRNVAGFFLYQYLVDPRLRLEWKPERKGFCGQ